MRILHFSKYEGKGGAAIAAFNSVCAQGDAGAEALMCVGSGAGREPFVIAPQGLGRLRSLANFAIERLPFRLSGRSRFDTRSLGVAGLDAPGIAAATGADLAVLHNIDGLVRVADLPRFPCPIVWRTHDMWAMCGTEHYVEDSGPYRSDEVGHIPDLLSRWTFRRKQRAYPQVTSLTICSPSHWLRREMAASQLLGARDAVAIPNGIDTRLFAPMPRTDARGALSLPATAPLILFGSAGGAEDPRKGFDLLVGAIRRAVPMLSAGGVELVTFGGGVVPELPLPVHRLGQISDRQRLRQVYAAADVAVVPSRLENLSLMVLEALACGTPVIAFDIGGMPDMIRPGESGWLIPPFDIDQLGQRLVEVLGEGHSDPIIRRRCRALVEAEFSLPGEAQAMLALFELILGKQDRALA